MIVFSTCNILKAILSAFLLRKAIKQGYGRDISDIYLKNKGFPNHFLISHRQIGTKVTNGKLRIQVSDFHVWKLYDNLGINTFYSWLDNWQKNVFLFEICSNQGFNRTLPKLEIFLSLITYRGFWLLIPKKTCQGREDLVRTDLDTLTF